MRFSFLYGTLTLSFLTPLALSQCKTLVYTDCSCPGS